VIIHQTTTETQNEALISWLLFAIGWFTGGSLCCWIPGAIFGLRSQNPEARIPGILNAVFSGIFVIVIVVIIIYFIVMANAITYH